MRNKKINLVYLFVFGIIFFFGFVSSVVWKSGIENFSGVEDVFYEYDVSQNVTDIGDNLDIGIDTLLNKSISWDNGTQIFNYTSLISLPWFDFDESTFILSMNLTRDNQSGIFRIPFQIKDNDTEGIVKTLVFVLNATNDAPLFSQINSLYNLTQNQQFLSLINATDEEGHFPLTFNMTFIDNCTHAFWSGRNAGENCSLFNTEYVSSNSAYFNFTPSYNEVGTYWANVSVSDSGENYVCNSSFCANDYSENKTSYRIVEFRLLSTLDFNLSYCNNSILQEGEVFTCEINVTTKSESDNLRIWTNSSFRNYNANPYNSSWFYGYNSTTSSNFISTLLVNVTPTKNDIGNWTINFTAFDDSENQNITRQIYVYVNRTTNDLPDIFEIENLNTSINLNTRINISVYDDDLLILDKNESYGGYNETITFDKTILNLSSEAYVNDLFDITFIGNTNNLSSAKIEFTPTSSQAGSYQVNISGTDKEGTVDYELFNITILSNVAPEWNESTNVTIITNEDVNIYLNLSMNVSDADGDILTFSYTNDTRFDSFNLNSTTGIINFTPSDVDVGQHLVNITVSDELGLSDILLFNFTIYNVNDAPIFSAAPIQVNTPNASLSGNDIYTQEENYTKIYVWIEDDDFKILQKDFYNEEISFNFNLTGGPNPLLFSFVNSREVFPSAQLIMFYAEFIPEKTDIGDYNLSINISDASGIYNFSNFTLNISERNHNPSFSPSLANQTTAVNRSFVYNVNSSDIEDGTDSNGLLRYNLSFLSGVDFVNGNQSIFNSTSGLFNLRFNSTQAGRYHINVTINDTTGLNSSSDFWIYVYDIPTINSPSLSYNYSLDENTSSSLTFNLTHNVADNITYLFYLDNILRKNETSYGNGTNFTWDFTPNYTDETYGNYTNLTLIAYPTSSSLVNASLVNVTQTWNANITHTNSPINFITNIGKHQGTVGTPLTIDLSDYFIDYDAFDSYYNQFINFSISKDSDPSYILWSVDNFILTLNSLIATDEFLTLNGSDLDELNNTITSVSSNPFEVEFTAPVVVTTPAKGGGSNPVPVSLKIIIPDPVSAYRGDRIILPLTLYNSGKKSLSGIDLSSYIAKNMQLRGDIKISFDKTHFDSLDVGESKNVTMIVEVNTEELGLFEITLNASVQSPKYNDWGKLYLTIKEGDKIQERIFFTEEFLAENPNCLELQELVNEAKRLYDSGEFDLATEKSQEAIDACKEAISQPGLPFLRDSFETTMYNYLLIATLSTFLIGIAYYSYRRMRLRRGLEKF